MVVTEAQLVEERVNSAAATQAVLFQMALLTVPSMGSDPNETHKVMTSFQGVIKKLTGG